MVVDLKDSNGATIVVSFELKSDYEKKLRNQPNCKRIWEDEKEVEEPII